MALQSAVDRLGGVIIGICNAEDNHDIADLDSINSSTVPLLSNEILCDSQPLAVVLERLVSVEVREILELAATLLKESTHSNMSSSSTPRKMISNPRAPPTVLSINHLRIVYTTIEVLWICGVKPLLGTILGGNFEWGEGPHPKSLLVTKESMTHLSKKCSAGFDLNQTMRYVRCIYSLVSNPLFLTNMLPRNLRRLLVALLLMTKYDEILTERRKRHMAPEEIDLSYGHTDRNIDEIIVAARSLLDIICFQSDNKTFVVSELRVATRGPSWMRTAASEIFSKIILSDGGFECVLRAYLEGDL